MTARDTRILFVMALWLVVVCAPARAQPGRVSGRVKTESGQPVSGAEVVAENPEGAPDRLKTVTDRNGRFAMIGLRPGVWSLRILAAGYEPLRTAMRVSAVRAVLSTDYQLRKLEAPRPGPLGGLDVKTVQADLAAADRLLQAGEADEAIRAYRTLLTRIPTLTTLNLRIGAAFRLEGDDDAAVAAYQAAIDAGAAPAKAHLRIAEIAVDRGDAATARVHLEQVLSLAPASDQAAEARALLERVQSGR